jgi:exonuclease VII small subunit
MSFEEAEPSLRQWWIGHRLADAVEQFFSNARQRVSITLLIDNRDEVETEPVGP